MFALRSVSSTFSFSTPLMHNAGVNWNAEDDHAPPPFHPRPALPSFPVARAEGNSCTP